MIESRSATLSRMDEACRRSDDGYTLVALLAVMTLLALFALAAAPSIRQQTQREREKETIFRGEQVADAIATYYTYRRVVLRIPSTQALPTSMDQLLEGIPIPGGSKKRQILRVSATRDPLSETGEWGYVAPQSQRLLDFAESVALYSGGVLPPPGSSQVVEMQQFSVPPLIQTSNGVRPSTTGASDDASDDSGGPFVGVTSRSRNGSVLYYYGIDQHNHWIFTPLFKR